MEDESTRARRLLSDYVARIRTVDLRDQLDAAAADLLAAFAGAGVPALLLKGPVLARVLYRHGEQRMYSDVDVLVDPAALPDARRVLRERGFVCTQEQLGIEDGHAALHAEEWSGGFVPLDLHWRLPASTASAELCWKSLYASHQLIELDAHRVPALSRAGLALHIAIHAAQHGERHASGMRDLELALARWPAELWREAAVLAGELGATGAFATGLRVLPAGCELAERLALPESSQLNWIPAAELPRGTSHLRAFADAGSLSDRVRVLRRALLPPARWIRWQYQWSARFPALLLPAYGLHLLRAPWWGLRALRFHRRRGRPPV